jgi:2'-hydroxyisoflavone reductase
MKLLVIGGTEFLGRAVVEAALARGDEVTLFNRGRSHAELFPEVAKLRGDRSDPADLAALKNGRWDAVIDTCGYVSAHVRATAEALADRVEHYTFISSISAYADNSRPGQDESAPLATLGEAAEDGADMATYGARKALCEQAAEDVLPGRVLNLRAGLLIGPHDYIDRFPYWLGRIARGGEVLAPGDPDQPVQLIDVRDMAEWNLRMAERRAAGIFNTTGPDYRLTMGAMLEACRQASGSDATFTWVAGQFLLDHGVAPWTELPIWLPDSPEMAGFMAYDCSKAQAAGLTCRPILETARDTLAWLRTRPDPAAAGRMARAMPQPGISAERERQLLDEWHAAGGR